MESDLLIRSIRTAVALVLALTVAAPTYSDSSIPANATATSVERLIIKRRSVLSARGVAVAPGGLRALGERASVSLSAVRKMSGGSEVVKLSRAMTTDEAENVAARLRQDPSVELVEPDRWVAPFFVPNDPSYSAQWHLQDARSEIASTNLPDAWDFASSYGPVVVAVIDTGLVPHADIDASRVLPGYDFVSDIFAANDGDGRDSDPTDPGDWVSAADAKAHTGCGSVARNSSWHGTRVAGIIAASTDNSVGVSGVDRSAKILPVRVLGRCGGYLSDVLDGARWAAGVSDPYLPSNPNPAKVLNLSLGAVTSCTPLVQNAINDVLARGAVVVAAAGNTAGDASAISPGNCAGVIAVAALDRNGNKAYYSSFGVTVALGAPGGAQSFLNDPLGIYSISNTSTTSPAASPGGDTYEFAQGTSMSAPLVAGVASMMLAVNPSLSPDQIRHKLLATARAFPAGSNCTTTTCGAGMLDAAVAMQSASNAIAPTANAGADLSTLGNTVVALSASGSSAVSPASIARYQWTQVSGPSVTISNANDMGPSFVAPVEGGTLQFQLTVADDGGLMANDMVAVEVAAVPVSSTSAPSSEGGGDSRCFIATAAYGAPDRSAVLQLRRFRDRFLLTNPVGRSMVATYYRLSPPFADAIRPYPLLRKLIRIGLTPYVAVARWWNQGANASR